MAAFTPQQRAEFVARVAFSVFVLGAGLYVILKGSYSDTAEKWAIGVVGLVLGYWLK